jgi:hypothetical protein
MIRFIKATHDKKNPKVKFKIGDEIDLGKDRNQSAVDRGLAVFVEEKPKEKAETVKASRKPKAEK